jgi:hypothetical protein
VYTLQERRVWSERLRTVADELETLVKELTHEQLTTPYLPGEWTVAQNIHHLADAQMTLFFRFKLIVLADYPTVVPFDQNIWAETPDATNANIADSLGIIRGVHRRWAVLAESLDDAAWARTGYHPESGDITPDDILSYAARHGELHVEQIAKILAVGT